MHNNLTFTSSSQVYGGVNNASAMSIQQHNSTSQGKNVNPNRSMSGQGSQMIMMRQTGTTAANSTNHSSAIKHIGGGSSQKQQSLQQM